MPIPVSEVLKRAGIILNDDQFVRWTKEELIGWINDGAAEIVIRRPSAHAITETVELQAGVLQRIPVGGIQLLDIPATEDGYPVRRVDRQLLDDQYPGWRRLKAGRTKHYTYDERTATTFYVYPAAVAGAKVEMFYSSPPPDVSSDTDSLDLDRVYMSPLVSFVLYRALAKDSEYSDGALAAAHYGAFGDALGQQNETAAAASPNVGSV
ncbi:hypothetical protein [Pseudomonas phage Itty13]|uniref:Uncharacterized protein n=1 Tax=Pseudomonas phage Itty13 TaxID=2805750 RepID=A0A889IR53_9CAUD|nr:structural protein [Pseudomonas phage Itty13]QRE00594.1 hypothetical protein [Pseudomonas phage Itty13]